MGSDAPALAHRRPALKRPRFDRFDPQGVFLFSGRMGPLEGVRVIELAGIGPGPFCAMLLGDMGAEVVRIGRPGKPVDRLDILNRNKKSITIDLKRSRGHALALTLIESAQILIEGFRPGVMERLGLSPAECHAVNPRLIYGRMTGWGQSGPLAEAAGHDLNYIALTGALHAIGRKGQPPTPPLNLLGDFGGGALYLAFGLICALREAERSGQGQVVDAAMVDGAAHLMTAIYGLRAAGLWDGGRGENFLDSGAPYYEVYETKDGAYVALAAIEPQFFAELLMRLDLPAELAQIQNDRAQWPRLRAAIAEKIAAKTRGQWCELMEGSEACFAPVLGMDEAPAHPHNKVRSNFIEVAGIPLPAPAPRFSRTPAGPVSPPPGPGDHTDALLTAQGLDAAAIGRLRAEGIVE
jgi:alpha-methylacyl-CoA racemase